MAYDLTIIDVIFFSSRRHTKMLLGLDSYLKKGMNVVDNRISDFENN